MACSKDVLRVVWIKNLAMACSKDVLGAVWIQNMVYSY